MKDKSRITAAITVPAFFILLAFLLMTLAGYRLGFKEQVGIFFTGSGCMARYLAAPAVVSSFMGDLLTRFYILNPVAVAITVLLLIAVWASMRSYLKKRANVSLAWLWALPVAALAAAFAVYPNYPVSALVGLTIAIWCATMLAGIRSSLARAIATAAATPVLFILIGGHALCFAILMIMSSLPEPSSQQAVPNQDTMNQAAPNQSAPNQAAQNQITQNQAVQNTESQPQVKDGRQGSFKLVFPAAVIGIALMLLVGRLYNLPLELTLISPAVSGYVLPSTGALMLLPLLLVVTVLAARNVKGTVAMASLAGVCTGLTVIPFASAVNDSDMEYSIKVGTTAYYGDWEQTRQLGQQNHGNRYGLYFRNLSYAREGLLPENLLTINQYMLSDGLFLSATERDNYLDIFYYPMALIEMGDFPHATDCALLGQTVMPGGYSTRMMRTLSEISVAAGDYDVALKYLDILSRTPGHRRWAGNLTACIKADSIPEKYLNLRSRASQTDVFVPQGDTRSALRAIANDNPLNKVAADYLMCSLLLEKNLNTFIGLYDRYYLDVLDNFVQVPELYQEALLVNVNSDESLNATIERYHLSQPVIDKYMDFLKTQTESQGDPRAMSRFRGTYWYYIMSTRLAPNPEDSEQQ